MTCDVSAHCSEFDVTRGAAGKPIISHSYYKIKTWQVRWSICHYHVQLPGTSIGCPLTGHALQFGSHTFTMTLVAGEPVDKWTFATPAVCLFITLPQCMFGCPVSDMEIFMQWIVY